MFGNSREVFRHFIERQVHSLPPGRETNLSPLTNVSDLALQERDTMRAQLRSEGKSPKEIDARVYAFYLGQQKKRF